MRAGKMRHRAEVHNPLDLTEASEQGEVVSYKPTGEYVWCAIEPLSGEEALFAQQFRGDVTHKITMRNRSSLTERHRLVWNKRSFNLGPPLSTEEQGFDMVFTATEVRGQ